MLYVNDALRSEKESGTEMTKKQKDELMHKATEEWKQEPASVQARFKLLAKRSRDSKRALQASEPEKLEDFTSDILGLSDEQWPLKPVRI